MRRTSQLKKGLFAFALTTAGVLSVSPSRADAVTDWNQFTIEATKGFNGTAGAGVVLDTNLGTRIEAIEARAVFDAVNSIDHFTSGSYYYSASNSGSRIASGARGLSLDRNASLFAVLDNVAADARIAAFTSKYEQKFWRPITAINAGPDGSVTNGYAVWHPLAATPSHPSNTAGHSTTGAAGFEILRAFFGSDSIGAGGSPVTLGSLPWLAGTNNGTGNASTRSVSTFSQAQLENGASRLYLGVHFGFDNFQGQLLGTAIADAIIVRSNDPAAAGLSIKGSVVSLDRLQWTLLKSPDLYGLFGQDAGLRGAGYN